MEYFRIACDVTNPLCGEQGAVYVYGPQKGVHQDEREELDRKMMHYVKKTEEWLEKEILEADLIITGEGRIDFQTAMGKLPAGVSLITKKIECHLVRRNFISPAIGFF